MSRDLAPDWILQQALSAQSTAHTAFVRGRPELRSQDGGLTLAVLGCGTMGKAILGGVMASLRSKSDSNKSEINGAEMMPARLPSKFNACVRTSASAKKVKEELGKYNTDLVVWENDNLGAVKESDIILLCSHLVGDILRQEGMGDALAGKLLISICAGVPESYIYDILYKEATAQSLEKCQIVRVMPNTAAAVRESMTIISTPNPALSEDNESLVRWIFNRVGKVTQLPASTTNAATALCSSGPAFCAVMIESMASGAIAEGIPREEAYILAAQTMKGAAALVLQGEHPAIVRDNVSTPGGCTIAGIQALEEGRFRSTVAKAVREASSKAGSLESKRETETLTMNGLHLRNGTK